MPFFIDGSRDRHRNTKETTRGGHTDLNKIKIAKNNEKHGGEM
jgi:hypothetical protein